MAITFTDKSVRPPPFSRAVWNFGEAKHSSDWWLVTWWPWEPKRSSYKHSVHLWAHIAERTLHPGTDCWTNPLPIRYPKQLHSRRACERDDVAMISYACNVSCAEDGFYRYASWRRELDPALLVLS